MRKLKELKESHLPPPPCSDEPASTPPPDVELNKKLVLIYHDESIFSANEGQQWMWASEDMSVLKPKTRRSGIMVSDYINQHNGFLRLGDEEHWNAKAGDPNFPKVAKAQLEHGAEQ